MNIIALGVFIGTMTITSYRSVPSQTDNSPYYTSIGEHVNPHGCAISRDLFQSAGGQLNYGDLIYIEGYGYKFVNDTMNKRIKQHIDIWVKTYAEEKKVGVTNKRIWLIKREVICQKATKKQRIGVRSVGKLLGLLLRMIY